MDKKLLFREKSLTATLIMIVTISALFLIAYLQINSLMRERSLARMEEGVNTVIAEVDQKLSRDSQILKAVANTLTNLENFDEQSLRETMAVFSPLMETMKIRIFLPNNVALDATGETIDGNGILSFDELAIQGEHVSDPVKGFIDEGLILRHFVPVVKNGETVAILYGVTLLSDLPNTLNIDNIYNADASVFIIDTKSGDMIMDTWNDTPGSLSELSTRKTKDNTDWNVKLQEIKDGKRGYVVFWSRKTNEWLYFYYAPANVNQWVIAVSVTEKEAFTNLFAVRRIFLIIAILTAISVTLYYFWVLKNAKYTVAKAVENAVLEEKLQKAEAAERAKTMFLSNMSHDIRTPMNAIIGFTTLAQTNIDNKERVQDYLSKILSSGNHLLGLINDVLDMSRIESGRLNIEEKECHISDIFKDMRNIVQTQMQAKQLNFFMDTVDVIDEDIYCDKLHINQVLLNLLSNACKFTPAGGSVSLKIKQKPGAPSGYGTYEIRVKDTGIGMSPEFAEHVFEPFEREKTSTVSGIQGTGLGMAITKSIIDAMGGTIQVETEQGKGTEYIIELDFRLVEESKQIEVIHELEGLRALVVDDNFDTCDSITKMLTQIGMRSEWTMHGKEAVLRAKQAVEMADAFYAYIIDWVLPDLNGIEVARQIRSVVGEDTPIIILTAYDWTDIEDEARRAGVTAFCNKPLFLSDLRDTLASVINKSDTSTKEVILPDMKDLTGKRLLLVEDNELNREIATEILTGSGFLVETAEDGTIAVDIVNASQPGYFDLILMDVQMPIMNGYEATKAIRALDNPALAFIPIVAMTANAFDEDRQRALDSGMNAHVAKPIDVEKLMAVLHALLDPNEE